MSRTRTMEQAAGTPDSSDGDVAARVRAAMDAGRDAVASILEPACPSVAFLAALGEEVAAAAADPSAVPFPELADPDAYWDATVRPQDLSARRAVAVVLERLEGQFADMIAESETELAAWAAEAAARDGGEPSARAAAIDTIASHCQMLHHLFAEVAGVLPSDSTLVEAQHALEEGRRQRAIADVDALRLPYLQAAGGDDAHQAYAAEQWQLTFGERVAHRDALLRAEVPWRHQELAITGHTRTRSAIVGMLEELVERLQAPLLGVGERLVHHYDNAVASS